MDDGSAGSGWLPGWLLLLLLRLRTILLVATYSRYRGSPSSIMHRCTASSQHSCWFSSACAGRND
jgi:hypothetical protein